LTGITEIYIYIQDSEQFSQLMDVLVLLEYKNLKKITIRHGFNFQILNPQILKQFFKKIPNVQIMIITYLILIEILDIYVFKYIHSLHILYFKNDDFDIKQFKLFINNNNWKYLQT
jgi:hypothetical protein